MLYEIKQVKQDTPNRTKRWFMDHYFDLFVWQDKKDLITAFQLSYDKSFHERAITWQKRGGYMHTRVDDGEERADSQMSPILVSDGVFDNRTVAEQFWDAAKEIDTDIRKFVYDKIMQFPAERNY